MKTLSADSYNKRSQWNSHKLEEHYENDCQNQYRYVRLLQHRNEIGSRVQNEIKSICQGILSSRPCDCEADLTEKILMTIKA